MRKTRKCISKSERDSKMHSDLTFLFLEKIFVKFEWSSCICMRWIMPWNWPINMRLNRKQTFFLSSFLCSVFVYWTSLFLCTSFSRSNQRLLRLHIEQFERWVSSLRSSLSTRRSNVSFRYFKFVVVSLFSARGVGTLGFAATLSKPNRFKPAIDHCRWFRWLVDLCLAAYGRGNRGLVEDPDERVLLGGEQLRDEHVWIELSSEGLSWR